MAVLRTVLAFVVAAATALIAAAAFHSQMTIGALNGAGAGVDAQTRLDMTMNDLLGLAPQYGVIIALALLIGFAIAAILSRILKPLAPIAYPVAGAAAIAVMLTIMPILLKLDGITPIAGARGALGFGLQCLAGLLGGVVFAAIARRRA